MFRGEAQRRILIKEIAELESQLKKLEDHNPKKMSHQGNSLWASTLAQTYTKLHEKNDEYYDWYN